MTRRPMFLSAAVVALAVSSTACDDDEIVATAPLADWTVMVYMAGDNNIAEDGKRSLTEMRAANRSSRVNVVAQADFPNQNTFRELISGAETSTIDIGERDMSLPSELREFVEWSNQNLPAQRSLLVLWDHGSQYQGLLTDDAHASIMPISGLTEALSGTSMDVLAFDMCLMGGYETLAKVAGFPSFTVFSENEVPFASFPYTPILNAITSKPSADARAVAELIPDHFVESYADSFFVESFADSFSVTLSSYDMAGFAPFRTALDSLAIFLDRQVSDTTRTLAHSKHYVDAIRAAAASSQSYGDADGDFTEVRDIVDFLDSLDVRLNENDDSTRAKVADLKKRALDPAFRLKNAFQTGQGSDEIKVDRSNGLSIVLPSVRGEANLDIYWDQFFASHWGDFLGVYNDSIPKDDSQPPADAGPEGLKKCLDDVAP